jgi:hypothetical protein
MGVLLLLLLLLLLLRFFVVVVVIMLYSVTRTVCWNVTSSSCGRLSVRKSEKVKNR